MRTPWGEGAFRLGRKKKKYQKGHQLGMEERRTSKNGNMANGRQNMLPPRKVVLSRNLTKRKDSLPVRECRRAPGPGSKARRCTVGGGKREGRRVSSCRQTCEKALQW